MNNNKNILYITQGNRETIIHTIDEKIVVRDSLEKLIDKWCINYLTTYKGRLDAIKQNYHLKKLVPIYINKDLMLFPIDNKKSIDNIYVNIINIQDITDMLENTKLIFKNQEYIIVNKKYQLVKTYYHRCLKIYNLIRSKEL